MTIQTGRYSGLADPDDLYGNEHHCVSRILESETFCQPTLRARWKDYCPGGPRSAHRVGSSLPARPTSAG
jgi:hypothetical protein